MDLTKHYKLCENKLFDFEIEKVHGDNEIKTNLKFDGIK
jgi:hypothetical protein